MLNKLAGSKDTPAVIDKFRLHLLYMIEQPAVLLAAATHVQLQAFQLPEEITSIIGI